MKVSTVEKEKKLYLAHNLMIITKTPKKDTNSFKCCKNCYNEIICQKDPSYYSKIFDFPSPNVKTRKFEEKPLLPNKYSIIENNLLSL